MLSANVKLELQSLVGEGYACYCTGYSIRSEKCRCVSGASSCAAVSPEHVRREGFVEPAGYSLF